MKLKHLFALAAIAVSGSAWAQDVWKDVTSTHLTNAKLDGDYTSLSKINSTNLNSRTFQQPNGWSLYVSAANTNDASFLTSDDNASSYTSNIASQITLPAKSAVDGDRKLVVRINNSGSPRKFELYQNVTLSVGTYKISGKFNNKSTGYMRTGVYYKSSDDSNQRAQVTSSTSKDTWVDVEKTFTLSKEEKISVGFYFTQLNNNGWGIAAANDIKLEYNLTQALKDKITEASGIKIANDQSKYATTLEDAITEANNAKESQLIEELEKAISTLSSAITTYQEKTTIIQSLINVRTEIARAEAYSVVKTENATAYAGAIQAAKDAIDEDNDKDYSAVILAMQNFKVEDYKYVTTTYTERKTVGSWTGAYQPSWAQKDQHWSGSNGYYSDDYENNMSRKGTQTITLPAGDYVFYAIGRSDLKAMTYIKVADVTTNFTPKGSEGLGVDKTGVANFTVAEDTYANDNKGFGWEYRFIAFHLDETTDVNLEFGYYYTTEGTVWASISEPMLYMTAETKANNEIEALAQEIMDLVNNTTIPTTNVGEGAFQYSQDAIDLVQDQKDMYAEATASDLVALAQYQFGEGAAAFLEGFKEGVLGDIDAMNTLNQPAAGQRFHLNLISKGTTTFVANSSAQGGYSVTFNTVESNNYPQAFELTPVADAAETNMYTLSFTDADGETRYICNGIPYSAGTGAYGIRTITDSEKALVVKVVATAVEGEYNLLNTTTDGGYKKLGSNGGDFYTDDKYSTFTITEAAKASATLKVTDAKYGTFIAPFAVEMPEGVTAYSAAVDGSSVKLNKIAEGGETLAANTPCVVYSESEVNETFEDWGLATTASYSADALTGAYALTAVAANDGKYMLQNGTNGIAFYLVDKAAHIGANRCYLTAPAGTEIKALVFDTEADAIQNIEVAGENKATIYDLSGRKVSKAQKGLYIVNGKKVVK